MTFRINYPYEDFLGLTRLNLSTLQVEDWYLMLIQQDNYHHQIENASKLCIT